MELVAIAALFLGGFMQSATGFGFAVVAAPLLIAVYPPQEAVPALIVLAIAVSAFMLAGEGRRPQVMGRESIGVLVAAIPGTALGVVLLTTASTQLLRGLVAVAVLAAVFARLCTPPTTTAPNGLGAGTAGFFAGALGTSTGLNGPPLVLMLLRWGIDPDRSRDTLTAWFMALDVMIVISLVIADALIFVPGMPLLLAAAIVGQIVGRRTRRFVAAHHERISLAVLTLSGVVALLSVLGMVP